MSGAHNSARAAAQRLVQFVEEHPTHPVEFVYNDIVIVARYLGLDVKEDQ